MDEGVQSLTYSELAQALGITRESARQLAMRRRWPRRTGNDGRARVAVPVSELASPRDPPSDTPSITPDDTPDEAPQPETVAVLVRHVERLELELAKAQASLETERTRGAQVDVLKAVLDVERERVAELRAERDRWQALATAPRGLWAWLRGGA